MKEWGRIDACDNILLHNHFLDHVDLFLSFQPNLGVGSMSDSLHILHIPISYQVIYQKKWNAEKILQLMQFWLIAAQKSQKGQKTKHILNNIKKCDSYNL